MVYTKKIEDVTYKDIIDFCNEQIRENISLDYKEIIGVGLAKTIAAMANTVGGLIIIGVEDQDSKPKLPIKGIEVKEHLIEQINNIILGNITPPVFPETQICFSDDGQRALIVLRVPQSNITPHAIKNNAKVYIRTNTSNEPEELASIDRVLWLVNKREKSVELKDGFFEKADLRLKKMTGSHTSPILFGDLIFSASPLYPFDVLIDYKELIDPILQKIKCSIFSQSFPMNLNHEAFKPIQNGAYSLFFNKNTGYISYEEFNHFGFIYHREDIDRSQKDDAGNISHTSPLVRLLVGLHVFLHSIEKFYSIASYWGIVEIKVIMDNIGNINFIDLPAPRGMYKFDNLFVNPTENNIVFKREVTYKVLQEKEIDILIDIFTELSWSLGFSHINGAMIKELLERGF